MPMLVIDDVRPIDLPGVAPKVFGVDAHCDHEGRRYADVWLVNEETAGVLKKMLKHFQSVPSRTPTPEEVRRERLADEYVLRHPEILIRYPLPEGPAGIPPQESPESCDPVFLVGCP